MRLLCAANLSTPDMTEHISRQLWLRVWSRVSHYVFSFTIYKVFFNYIKFKTCLIETFQFMSLQDEDIILPESLKMVSCLGEILKLY